MASSTTKPMAKMMASKVSRLMVKPSIKSTIKVPIKATGRVMAGIKVARTSPRKRKITMITNNYTAALSVVTDYNKNALSIESIAEIKEVDEIPRNEFGKINRRKLQLTLEKTKDA